MARRRRGPPGRVRVHREHRRIERRKNDSPAPPSVVEALLDDAARCSLVNTVHFFEGDPKGEEGAPRLDNIRLGTWTSGEWPADSLVATQLASFRLATLRAFNVIHGGENARDPPLKRFGRRGGNVGYSNALVALCGTPVRPLPDSNLGSACVVALRLALGRRGDDADAGAWASGGGGGGDAALDELRAFDGGWDAPRDEEFFSGFGLGGYAKGSFRRGFSRRFPRPAASRRRCRRLASTRSRFYAPSTPPRCVSSRRRRGSSSKATSKVTIRIPRVTIRIRRKRFENGSNLTVRVPSGVPRVARERVRRVARVGGFRSIQILRRRIARRVVTRENRRRRRPVAMVRPRALARRRGALRASRRARGRRGRGVAPNLARGLAPSTPPRRRSDDRPGSQKTPRTIIPTLQPTTTARLAQSRRRVHSRGDVSTRGRARRHVRDQTPGSVAARDERAGGRGI